MKDKDDKGLIIQAFFEDFRKRIDKVEKIIKLGFPEERDNFGSMLN